ncbi:MAG TPA: Ig-like domain-containing domain [Chitinophagales bacterium]|nr:Ig-like domain-containing domain [Chitinophagales bacterium]
MHLLLLVLVVATQNRCAQESVPLGGPQDTAPPELKKASPPNKTIHFRSEKIKLTFNEFIKETGFAQTLISPPNAKRPVFHVEGRTLTIKLKSALRDSTTYTINFGDDLKDINEGNAAPNFTYVFSTGSFIDSQKVNGNLLLAKDNTPAKDVVIALYPNDSIDGILRSKPYYFAKTNESGNFKLENIKAGKYWIYALQDANYNYIYDQPNELIAFSDSLIDLNDTIAPTVNLNLFDENRKLLKLDEVRSLSPGQLQIVYNRPIKTFKLDWKGYSKDDFAYIYPTNDTIIYWFSKYYSEKDTFYLTANDTLLDTLRMELKFIKKDSLYAGNKYLLSVPNQAVARKNDTTKTNISSLQELNKPLKINFSRPITEISAYKKLRILVDSTLSGPEAKFTVDEKTKMFILVDFEKKENTKYTVEIPDSTVRDIFGMWNRKLVQQFTTNSKNSYGNLNITLKTEHPEKYYVIKLLNAAGELVKEFYLTGNGERKVSVNNILAGNYKFVVIEDENKNGEWDTGNFKEKRQPEKIFTYKDSYQLKGGWDLDVEVKF